MEKKKVIGLDQDQLYGPLVEYVAEWILKNINFSYRSLSAAASLSCIQITMCVRLIINLFGKVKYCVWDKSDKYDSQLQKQTHKREINKCGTIEIMIEDAFILMP